jgi:ElaB/YqjD/DUF883 family membrane-anchored ribosome-binding protein
MDEIRADMQETRASLADKLEALQDKTLDTVEAAQATVEQTVAAVQETVAAAKRNLDLRYQVQQRPWLMAGASVVTGSLVGYFLGHHGGTPDFEPSRNGAQPHHNLADSYRQPGAPASAQHRGLFAQEWEKLRGLAVGAGMALVRDWLKESAPQYADQIGEFMDNTTTKLGGETIQGPLFPQTSSGRPGS